jgi:hypothetical protein
MATWKSKDSVMWDQDMGFDYAKCETSWEYHTVSDYLTIKTKVGPFSTMDGGQPASEETKGISKAEALAMLETLIDWAETYEGSGTVEEMLKQRIPF